MKRIGILYGFGEACLRDLRRLPVCVLCVLFVGEGWGDEGGE